MLKIIVTRSEKLRDRVNERWLKGKDKSVKEKIDDMVAEIVRFEMSQTPEDYTAGRQPDNRLHRLTFIEEEIMLSFLYPRMDYNVSTQQNHLLKLPFSVHPSSRKISIPLFKRQLKDFNPANCVTIGDLLRDLDYTNLSGTVLLM
jgi:DNA primase small subunit